MILYDEVSEADVWKYWQTLFPEVNKEHDLKNMLNTCEPFDEKELSVFWYEHKADTREFMNWLSDHKGTFEYPEEWSGLISDDHINNIFYPIFLYEKDGIEKLTDRIYGSRVFGNGDKIRKSVIEEMFLRLREVTIRTFITEIHVERMSNRLKGNTPEERFCYYVDESWSSVDYVRRFYTEYQELLELQLTVFENALQSALEMIYRLDDDFPKLLKRFADGAEDIRIRDISQGLGDSHRGGRTVALITFSNGLRVVYKPRNIGAEKGFRYYSIAMNEGLCLGEKALYETKLLDCGEYGYMEFIQQEECKDAGGVERYFYRSGILMAMLYSLNAKDIHHENLIAHGEYPVMIDLEALFHSNLEHADIESEKSAYEIAMDSINDSVYSIGLLPSQLTNPFNKEEASVDISGFGGGDTEQVSPFKVLKIQNRNTDEICLKKSAYMIEPQKNVVKYEGEAVKSSDYTDFIMKGFEDAYKFIESHKSELAISFDLWFDSVCTRVIYRPTYLYTKLMFTGGHPDFMREKAHRYVLMHRMAYKIKKQEADIVKSEIRDMMTGDVPFFEVDIHSGELKNSEGYVLPISFKKTPLKCVEDKLRHMNDKDLIQQKSIIDNAFLSKTVSDYKDIWLTGTEWAREDTEPDKEDHRSLYIKMAKDIGDRILADAKESVVDGQKELAWINYTPVGHDRIIYEYGAVESDLYSGVTGIGLFFLYLWKVIGEKKYLDSAYACIRPVIHRMHKIADDSCYLTGPFNGLSGYIYVYSKFYLLTGDEDMKEAVLDGLSRMKKIYHRDTSYDVISGSAGAVKVCISLRTHFIGEIRDKADEMIRLLADHLVKNYTAAAGGEISWRSGINDHMYTGYAHGSSGIEEALASVYEIYPSEEIREVLDKSHRFMKMMYNRERHDWKTVFGKDSYSCAWCHGGPGILFSKMRQLREGLIPENVSEELMNSLSSMKERALGNNICYCHGDIGNLEMIRHIAKLLGDEGLERACRSTFEELVPRIPEYIEKRQLLSYGFMLGLSGIGYALLAAVSEDVPSVLILE